MAELNDGKIQTFKNMDFKICVISSILKLVPTSEELTTKYPFFGVWGSAHHGQQKVTSARGQKQA